MNTETDAERIAELEEDNRRLRRLLDLRDAPGELRHRFRSTLSMLRGIIRQTAESGRDRPDYLAQLEDRLDAIARAQALADLFGEINLQTLLADELLHYGAAEGERLNFSGPDVRLRPRAGQILALAIHELAVNAVEHGVLGADRGRVDVIWSVGFGEADPTLSLTWTESGSSVIHAEATEKGFGTEMLARMLPYELKAKTTIALNPAGLHCTICFPMSSQIGRIVPG